MVAFDVDKGNGLAVWISWGNVAVDEPTYISLGKEPTMASRLLFSWFHMQLFKLDLTVGSLSENWCLGDIIQTWQEAEGAT